MGFIPVCGISLLALSLSLWMLLSLSHAQSLSLVLQNLQHPAYPFLARYTHILIYISTFHIYMHVRCVRVCASVLCCVSFELKMEN